MSDSAIERDQPGVLLVVEADPCLNLATHQNGVPVLKRVTIENRRSAELSDLTVRVATQPSFADPLELRLASLGPASQHTWEVPALALKPAFLAGLRERESGSIEVDVRVGTETVAHERTEVAILAYDQWAGLRSLPELLCAFVLPNHPAVATLLRESAALLEAWTQSPSLSGYQAKSRERVAQTTAAIFHAIQSSGITYVVPPASFEREGQKIRTPDRIAEELLATCLDLAVLAAACLEQAGLNPLLVIVDGHAFAGVWLDDASFSEPALDDGAVLAKRAELGEILLFDPTAATNRPALTFDQAREAALTRLSKPDEFYCVIDVARSRRGGVRPLPLRAEGVQLEASIEPTAPQAPGEAPDLHLPRSVPEFGVIETPATRIERWKRRLLDLTNRNRLLNFVETKKTVKLEHRKLDAIENALSKGKSLTLRGALSEQQSARAAAHSIDPKVIDALVQAEFEAGRLVTRLSQEELDARLTEIFRSAREGLEEGGASGLYVALGFLEWYEDATSDQPRRAPLILVPVDIQRGSIRQGFKLTRAADETRFNTTLLEMLRVKALGIEIRGLDPLPEDDHGVDVARILQLVTAVLRDVRRWRVVEEAALGFFTFAKFLMWKDLDEQSDVLVANKIVSHLVSRPDRPFDPEWSEPDYAGLDDAHRVADVHCPVLADSSQMAAVLAAGNGKSFVLEGPPGTGKSQTITNLIAHCLSHGKTVLFVSEKTAALNVVFDRLRKIGLERFCLELHSNKASKSEVVRQLGESLRGARARAPHEWEAKAAELEQVRRELNAYARAISREHANGLSVFRVTSRLTALRTAPSIDLGWQDIGTRDRRGFDTLRHVLEDTRNALRATGEPHGHRLEGVGVEDASPSTITRIRERIADFRRELNSSATATVEAARAVEFDFTNASVTDFRVFASICDAAAKAPGRGSGMVARDLRVAERAIRDSCEVGRRRDALAAKVSKRFDLKILELDLLALRGAARDAASSWFLPRFFKTRSLRRSMLGVCRTGEKLDLDELSGGIERALELQELNGKLSKALAEVSEISSATWKAEESPWDELDRLLTWARAAHAGIAAAASDAARVPADTQRLARWCVSVRDSEGIVAVAEAGGAAIQRFLAAADGVAAELRLSNDDRWFSLRTAAIASEWQRRIERIEPALADMRAWALWRRLRSQFQGHELGALIGAIEGGAVRSDDIVHAFERSYYEAWLEWARAQEPILRDFLALSHEQRIERFRQLDEECTELARKVIEASISARVPTDASNAISGSELQVLQRELAKKTRHLGPRQLVEKAKSLMQRLKPCFLMSPISVAQYLPPGSMTFDLVVFDEASQIPTWDAVGAIARGKQAVVVGDSKQLPPTSFFDIVVQDDEREIEEVEELESILDECRAVGVPPLDLHWHYRSRHESLIAFSNRKYYRNRLCTFPSAAFEGLGVQWRHVTDGRYDKGRTRTNRVEAAALVQEVVRRLRDPELSKHSIGVVTFSAAQQRVVEDMLDQERRADQALDRYFVASESHREAVFIKNLENVQGDERDVILFSICYGPDETGRVSMNFGPLNGPGGERRLNVAVTRARRELIVFSTLTADQIDLSRTRAAGVADLKTFLSYAQHGSKALPSEAVAAATDDAFESPLEREICEALRARGHEVHSQVGCSGYRIDLAVVDAERLGRYLLGIECDGANYHTARTARDRDRLRQSVLSGLGWKLTRVWSSDWWERRDAELDRLCRAIDDAKLHAHLPPPPTALPTTVPSTDVAPTTTSEARIASAVDAPSLAGLREAPSEPALPQYRARKAHLLGTQDEFYSPGAMPCIKSELDAIVANDGPIRLERAAAQLAACFGFERTRAKVVERVDEAARSAQTRRVVHGSRVFLWHRNADPTTWREFRCSEPGDADQRDAIDLPPEEVANAAKHLLSASGACPRTDLLRALARLFGFRALGATVSRYLDEGIEHLLNEGRASVDETGRVETRG
ncbi:MAG: DUF4011 domain-containing protein [Planctomycetes bacterium]|nr:DUF4011 domain-containing protein [Planctomycetota bacterium]